MYSKKRMQKNSTTRGRVNSKKAQRSIRPVVKGIRISHKNSNFISHSVLHCCTNEEKIETILRLCKKHNYNVSEEDAIKYLSYMNGGCYPKIQNHNAIIRPWGNLFHCCGQAFLHTHYLLLYVHLNHCPLRL